MNAMAYVLIVLLSANPGAAQRNNNPVADTVWGQDFSSMSNCIVVRDTIRRSMRERLVSAECTLR